MRAHFPLLHVTAGVMGLLLAGCGGKTDDTAANPDMTCDPYTTELLSEIPVNEWPAGLDAALEAFNDLRGNFHLIDCNDPELEHTIEINLETQDNTGIIVGGGPPEGAVCGCHLDPNYDPDTSMNPIAVLPTIKLSIPQGLEPAGRANTYDLEGVAFGNGDDLLIRSCGHRTIDPADNSEYDDIYWFLRVDSSGHADMSMLLTKLGSNEPPKECHFTSLAKEL